MQRPAPSVAAHEHAGPGRHDEAVEPCRGARTGNGYDRAALPGKHGLAAERPFAKITFVALETAVVSYAVRQ